MTLMLCLTARVARVVAPKKAALKEAEAELAVAMEVRLLLMIIFTVYWFISLTLQESCEAPVM